MYNIGKHSLHTNLTSFETPVFFIDNLPAATDFTLNIFATNAKGRSDSTVLVTRTDPLPQRHARKGKYSQTNISLFYSINRNTCLRYTTE